MLVHSARFWLTNQLKPFKQKIKKLENTLHVFRCTFVKAGSTSMVGACNSLINK